MMTVLTLTAYDDRCYSSHVSSVRGRMMAVVSVHWRSILVFIAAVFALVLYNEFVVYYVVLLQCRWPDKLLSSDLAEAMGRSRKEAPLKVMLLADPHLLGERDGHWFDKLRREWHMERTFQSAMLLFNPEVVFVLGDLFDEGMWSTEAQFESYVSRFNQLFKHSANTNLHVVVGNHDVGFHYRIDADRLKRFSTVFAAPSVRLLRIKDVSFVMLNSMAFEGDHCDMCSEAEHQLNRVVKSLDCSEGRLLPSYCTSEKKFSYTQPIVLQHFPMFRESDANCSGEDSAPEGKKRDGFRPKWNCLSRRASKNILQWLRPRLIFSAHTHNFCQTPHAGGALEWTLASFSWRNRNNPSFMLAQISATSHEVNKCFHPSETTVVSTYIVGMVLIVGWFLVPRKVFSFYRTANKSH